MNLYLSARIVWPARFRDGFHLSTIAVYQDMAVAELGVRASYFGGCAGWFSLVGGTIPFSRR